MVTPAKAVFVVKPAMTSVVAPAPVIVGGATPG